MVTDSGRSLVGVLLPADPLHFSECPIASSKKSNIEQLMELDHELETRQQQVETAERDLQAEGRGHDESDKLEPEQRRVERIAKLLRALTERE